MKSLLPFLSETAIEAGCDEAGRGCLAGPVVAAAVILPKDFAHPLLNDSKKLTAKQRAILRPIIEENAVSYAVQFISPLEIDQINILNASILGMHRCIDELSLQPELLLIDGNRFHPYPKIPHECIIKGDGKYQSIAAASILAKTYRDAYMENLHLHFPFYNWQRNKGYPTKEHREAIRNYGSSAYHRQSFQLLPIKQLELFQH
jgi:ribonuclease HII